MNDDFKQDLIDFLKENLRLEIKNHRSLPDDGDFQIIRLVLCDEEISYAYIDANG